MNGQMEKQTALSTKIFLYFQILIQASNMDISLSLTPFCGMLCSSYLTVKLRVQINHRKPNLCLPLLSFKLMICRRLYFSPKQDIVCLSSRWR